MLLYEQTVGWLVVAREGDSEGRIHEWPYACRPDAEAMVRQLIDAAGGPEAWNDLTPLYRMEDG